MSKLPLNSTTIFELGIYLNFSVELVPGVIGDLIL